MPITLETLAAQPLLKDFPPRHLELLLADAMPAEFRAGEIIFSEGEPANRFYLIRSGKVAIESDTDDEHEPLLIELVGPGCLVGWSWLFPPYYWHFNARAASPVRAIFLYGARLRDRCEHDREFGFQWMKRLNQIVIERLLATRQRMAEQRKLPLAV